MARLLYGHRNSHDRHTCDTGTYYHDVAAARKRRRGSEGVEAVELASPVGGRGVWDRQHCRIPLASTHSDLDVSLTSITIKQGGDRRQTSGGAAATPNRRVLAF